MNFYGFYNDGSKHYIVMEWMSEGNLKTFLQKEKPNTLQLVLFSKQIVSAVNFLASKNIVHRDLALRNVLATRAESGSIMVKVSDFGLARALDSEGIYKTRKRELPFKWCAPGE